MSIAEELARIAAKVDEAAPDKQRYARPGRANGKKRAAQMLADLFATKARVKKMNAKIAGRQMLEFDQLSDDALIYIEAVAAVVPLSESSVKRKVAAGTFPAHCSERRFQGVGQARHLWRVGDVRRWLKANRP